MRFALAGAAFPVFLLACSSGSSSSGPGLTFSVSTPQGDASFPCGDGGSIGVYPGKQVLVVCNYTTVSPDGGATPTQASLALLTYEGSGVYTFQGSNNSSGSAVDFTLGNVSFGTQGPTAASPASSCEVTVTVPSSSATQGQISGSFHCDNVFANGPIDASSNFESISGQFGGEFSY